MSEWEHIAGTNEIAVGGRKSVVVDDLPALLLRIGDEYFCIEDTCTHDGQAMTNGEVHDHEITCPRHGARFDIRTGKALCMPATEPVQTFELEIREDGIFARLN
jgi:3-phenylpropionate/trans-cinnamate dioxygenase ferredoxin component